MMKRLKMLTLALALPSLLVACTHKTVAPQQPGEPAPTTTTTVPKTAEPPQQQQTEATPQVAPSGGALTPTPPKPRPVKIKIVVRSNPPKANVFWGKKPLGPTPVTLERPRDSGPVDLIVKADGYFPLHTRAYTFRNDAVWAKLTKLEERMNLFGAKHDQSTEQPAAAPPDGEPAAPLAAPAPAQ